MTSFLRRWVGQGQLLIISNNCPSPNLQLTVEADQTSLLKLEQR